MVSHTLTYFIMGALAAYFLNYAAAMARPESGMRPTTSAWVMAGPLFQPLRGLVFALVFYPLRESLFGKKYGWLLMGWMLIALGILSTFGPASGSIEGMIYTPVPVVAQLRGWVEVNHPGKKWLSWLLGSVFFIMMGLSILGLMTRRR